MKSRLFILIPVSMIAVAMVCIHIAFREPPSYLVAEEPLYNFGTIAEGRAVEASFKLTNTASEKIYVETLHASCSCTTSRLPLQALAPKEHTVIKAILDTTGSSGHKESKLSIRYQVDSEDHKRYLEVNLAGDVVPEFQVAPDKVVFSDSGEVATIQITPVGMKNPLEVSRVYTSSDLVTVASSGKENSSWVISLRSEFDELPDISEGVYLFVHTNSEIKPRLIVPISFVLTAS